ALRKKTIDAVRSAGSVGLRSTPAGSQKPVYAQSSGLQASGLQAVISRFSSAFGAVPGRLVGNCRAVPVAGWFGIGFIVIAMALWFSEPWSGSGWGSFWGSRLGSSERGRPQEQQVGQ